MHGLAKNILEKYNIDTSTMKLKTGVLITEYILKATEVAMYNDNYDTIIVDEAQELTRDQVDFIDALGSDFEHDTFDSVYLTGDFVHQRSHMILEELQSRLSKKMMMMKHLLVKNKGLGNIFKGQLQK